MYIVNNQFKTLELNNKYKFNPEIMKLLIENVIDKTKIYETLWQQDKKKGNEILTAISAATVPCYKNE